MSQPQVILVDDEKEVRLSYSQSLELAGFAVRAFASAEHALDLISPEFPGVVVSDIRMAGLDGMSFLSRVRSMDRELPVILITGHADTALAVAGMREGAYDFIEKPCRPRKLADVVARAADYRQLILENRRLRDWSTRQEDTIEARLMGRTPAIADLRRFIRTIAPSDADILLVGATGTGKGLVARLIHDVSKRAARPFVLVDCATLSHAAPEAELFGVEAGAAGSGRARFGKIEQAHGGTILFDNLSRMPLDLQARLARVMEDGALTRIGGHGSIPVDVRYMAALRVDPDAEVAAGRLSPELLYRLNVATIHLPRLDERREDISLLFLKLANDAAARMGTELDPVPPSILQDLINRPWPGNVRELANAAERYVLGVGHGPAPAAAQDSATSRRLADRVAEYERSLIIGTLATCGGNLKAAYEILGLSRKTLYEKMQKFGLDKRDFRDPDDPA